MAEQYEVMTQRQTVEVASPTEVGDIVEVMVRALPSGIVFPVRQPAAAATPERIAQLSAYGTSVIEAAVALPNVQTLSIVDDLNPAGLLELYANVYVASNSGRGQGVVHTQYANLFGPQLQGILQPEIDRLNAIEGL
jgi:hypothetical protein